MISPRTIVKETETQRPTFRIPKPDAGFGGWGPRLRY
jgi:hypothetical protein